MRFIVAFLLLLFGPIGGLGGFVYAFGWATFLCVWKIADMVDDLKPNKGKTVNAKRLAHADEKLTDQKEAP